MIIGNTIYTIAPLFQWFRTSQTIPHNRETLAREDIDEINAWLNEEQRDELRNILNPPEERGRRANRGGNRNRDRAVSPRRRGG